MQSRYSVVVLSGVRIPAGQSDLSPLLQYVQTHTASYSLGTWVLSWGKRGWGTKLTAHLHLGLRLRISGAISLIPIYAYMAWAGKICRF